MNKTVGYTIVVVVAYDVLATIIPFLIVAVIGLVAWNVYQSHKRH